MHSQEYFERFIKYAKKRHTENELRCTQEPTVAVNIEVYHIFFLDLISCFPPQL